MQPEEPFAQLHLRFTDPIQYDYEVIRPIVLFSQPVTDRSEETEMPRTTVREKAKRFVTEGMLGLVDKRSEVPAIAVPTEWQCSKGHVWQTAYHVIQHGAGCPTCANIAKRNPPAMYVELARKRGFVWLGPEVPNVRTKSWWRCPAGHRWPARYDSIKLGTGCPVCAGKREPDWPG